MADPILDRLASVENANKHISSRISLVELDVRRLTGSPVAVLGAIEAIEKLQSDRTDLIARIDALVGRLDRHSDRFEKLEAERGTEIKELVDTHEGRLNNLSNFLHDKFESIKQALSQMAGEIDEVDDNAIRQLRAELFGDEQATEQYEVHLKRYQEARRGYVTPNVAPTKPPKGIIEALSDAQLMVSEKLTSLEAAIHAVRAESARKDAARDGFADRVGASIGPLLDDPEFRPPLNGQQVASKSWVDKQLQVLAGAIRAEQHDARYLASMFADWGKELQRTTTDGLRSNADRMATAWAALVSTWNWMTEQVGKQSAPSRFTIARRALGQIITGSIPRE